MKLVEGEENQIRRVFDNIQAVCKAADCNLNDVVKLNVSLKDLSIFGKVNEIMLDYFEEPYPARAALQVARLPLDSLIEVEAIIIKEKG
jgi:reactive intermediate/imine deaminase